MRVTATEPAPRKTDLPTLAALEPVRSLARRWPVVAGVALSLAMVWGLARELLDHGLAGFSRTVPHSPLFYLFYAASYLALPVSDWLIFRRLWNVGPSAFIALNKKRIANDVLIGYSGDAYFYLWARARMKMVAAPFGAVKDVGIVSGIAGNIVTLLLAAIALPLGSELIEPDVMRMMLWSLSVPLLVSVVVLAFSRRVFSLPRRDLWFIFRMDATRIVLTALLLALAWSVAMPKVAVGMWLFLVAGRQLVSRLPLVPNKDLLFANFAILVVGHDRALSDLMAFTGASFLLMHLLMTAVFGAQYVVERINKWRISG